MVERLSALAGHDHTGKSGRLDEQGNAAVCLQNIQGLVLYQVAAWPDSCRMVSELIAKTAGCPQEPEPDQAATGSHAVAMRIEPLKWWLYGVTAPIIDVEQGVTLDLSHSRTHIRVSGSAAATLLNRHLPLDLREAAFPVGSVASSVMHHAGVTLWHSDKGYELLMPRGFALSLWQGLLASAEQFGVEVVA